MSWVKIFFHENRESNDICGISRGRMRDWTGSQLQEHVGIEYRVRRTFNRDLTSLFNHLGLQPATAGQLREVVASIGLTTITEWKRWLVMYLEIIGADVACIVTMMVASTTSNYHHSEKVLLQLHSTIF